MARQANATSAKAAYMARRALDQDGGVARPPPDDEGAGGIERRRQADHHGEVAEGRDHVPGSKALVGSPPSDGAT